MEQKPSLYQNKDEEALRDVFIAMLERRFQSVTVTAESFNHIGKTDILLKDSTNSSNLFVGECKIWHGKNILWKLSANYLTDTLHGEIQIQLLWYLLKELIFQLL